MAVTDSLAEHAAMIERHAFALCLDLLSAKQRGLQISWLIQCCMMQQGEDSPEVWEAVLGCLVQLTTHNGYTVRAFLVGISQKVVAALLHCCVHHRWSDEVYCQLIRIAVNLLYIPQPTQVTSDEDDDAGAAAQGQAPSQTWSLLESCTIMVL